MTISQKTLHYLERLGNYIGLISVIIILISAFFLQIHEDELPCPLCLLQRVGLIGIGIGFLCNLKYEFSVKHYAISLLSAIYTAAVALRQVSLHILPNTGAYGDPIFGLHLYTWCFILAVCFIIGISILLFITDATRKKHSNNKWQLITHILIVIFATIILANAISVFLECGIYSCPDNPVNYEIIDKLLN